MNLFRLLTLIKKIAESRNTNLCRRREPLEFGLMDEAAITRYITDTFKGVEVVVASGDSFFFYDPDRNPDNRKFPFATLVTNDNYDKFSNLGRPSVFRLNVGVSKQTFRSLFASQTSPSGADDGVDGDYDFTALDQTVLSVIIL